MSQASLNQDINYGHHAGSNPLNGLLDSSKKGSNRRLPTKHAASPRLKAAPTLKADQHEIAKFINSRSHADFLRTQVAQLQKSLQVLLLKMRTLLQTSAEPRATDKTVLQ